MANIIKKQVESIGKSAKKAASQLAILSTREKDLALSAIAQKVREQSDAILNANIKDLIQAKTKQLSLAMQDRLLLSPERIEAMAQALELIAALPSPCGKVLATFKRPNGLEITRVSVPLGVIGVIYESRPNVTIDAAGLCLKSGNAVVLRGSSDSFHSSHAIMQAINQGLIQTNMPVHAVQMIPTPDRAAVIEMLQLHQYIDVLIPRGGKELVKFISAHSYIPLFKHLAGICHTYLHHSAEKEMAKKIVLNAKMRRTGICSATEVLLIDEAILFSHLPDILSTLIEAGCEIRGDSQVVALDKRAKLAEKVDYETEFLAAVLTVKVVKNIDEAIQHISAHSTQHTESIIANEAEAANLFFREIDSAIIMHNTSTQFADGGEFGMGAEIGIATGKLHARGPVGLEQLTTFKYLVRGSGQIREG